MAPMEDLPYVDEHTIRVPAARTVVWQALAGSTALLRSVSRLSV